MDCLGSFESLSADIRIALGFFNVIISLLATWGNLLVFYLSLANRSLRTRSNCFLLSLAMSDLLVGILIEPIHVMQTISLDFAKNCTLNAVRRYLTALATGASIAALVAISYDRYVHLSQTLNYNDYMRRWKLVAIIGICWSAPFLASILTRSIIKTELANLVSISIYGISATVLAIICYVKIFRIINLKRKELERYQEGTAAAEQQRFQKQRNLRTNERAVKTITILLGCFCIFVAPVAVFMGFSAIKSMIQKPEVKKQAQEMSGTDVAYSVLLMVVMANSALNPVIYCFKIPEFRQAAKRLFRHMVSKISTNENRE